MYVCKSHDAWTIRLTIANELFSSIDNDNDHIMHSKSDNIDE